MTKTKESVKRVKDLKAQVGEILNATGCLGDDFIKSMKETLSMEKKEENE